MSSDGPSTAAARSRRRYMPGSARSKTIELGTLSEIEEDLYQNRKDVAEPCSTTRDDSFLGSVGTIRRPSRGSVKAIARSLSEKYKAAAARNQAEEEAEQDIEANNNNIPKPVLKTRQYTEELGITRSMSERRQFRPDRQPSETYLHEWSAHRPSASEFHARPPSAISRHGSIMAPSSLSRSPSAAGRMLIYDPRTMSLVDPAMPNSSKLPDYPVPVWIPPPSPMYIPLGGPVMPYPQKGPSLPEHDSACSEICCGGVAQLLWTIIAIMLVGIIIVLILALFYV